MLEMEDHQFGLCSHRQETRVYPSLVQTNFPENNRQIMAFYGYGFTLALSSIFGLQTKKLQIKI